MLAALKVASRRINNDAHNGVLHRLSRSLLSIISKCMRLSLSTTVVSFVLLNFPSHIHTVNGPFRARRQITSTNDPGLPEQPYHAFLAGATGGYIVWGRYSGVNYQLVLYLASRILVGCIKLARDKGIQPFSWKRLTFTKTYPLAAAGVWGVVMMLFEEYPETLHPSLRRSMDEIYRFESFGSSTGMGQRSNG